MGWLQRLRGQLLLQPSPHMFWMEGCDGTCVVQISPPVLYRPHVGCIKLNMVTLSRLLRPRIPRAVVQRPAPRTPISISELPGPAIDAIWDLLDGDSKRSVRLASKEFCAVSSRSIRTLSTRPRRDQSRRGISQRPPVFEGLSEIQLATGPGSLQDPHQVLDLLSRARQLRHIRVLVVDHGMRGVPFQHLARFLVTCPTLTQLHLPHHRFSTATEQRQLATVLEALLHLQQLNLGIGGDHGGATSLPPTVLRRIARLKHLQLLRCDASAAEDHLLFKDLSGLTQLHMRTTAPDSNAVELLQSLHHLQDVQLVSSSLTDACVEGLAGLTSLRQLDLSGCLHITSTVVPQVAAHTALEQLGLPCGLSDADLELLSKLPHLSSLQTRGQLQLPLPGPDHAPLQGVTQLVTAGVEFRGLGLETRFPALQQLVARRLSAEEAAALRGCSELRHLTAQDASSLTDRGLAVMGQLQQLEALELHDAQQVTDEGFQLMCSRPLLRLQRLVLGGFMGITDAASLHLTASCRSLSSITLKDCPRIGDETLRRISHCQQVTRVTIRRCGWRVSDRGVMALLGAVRMARVEVSGCPAVQLMQRPAGSRAAVMLVVEGREL